MPPPTERPREIPPERLRQLDRYVKQMLSRIRFSDLTDANRDQVREFIAEPGVFDLLFETVGMSTHQGLMVWWEPRPAFRRFIEALDCGPADTLDFIEWARAINHNNTNTRGAYACH